jgi:hypothetical protein
MTPAPPLFSSMGVTLHSISAMEARNIGLEQERQLRLAMRIDARSTANAGGEVDETYTVRY